MVGGMRRVGGVCGMCMCLARGGVRGEGGEWMRGLGLGLPIMWEQGECWTCVCVWIAVVSVVWVESRCREIGPGYGGVVLCMCGL